MLNSIRQKVRDFVVENFMFGEKTDIPDDHSFLESGIIDSTGVLELVGFIETEFGVTIADAELIPANLDSIEQVVQFVERKLKDVEPTVAG
jgi:acyl carrier protein